MLFTILFAIWTIIGTVSMAHLIKEISYGEALFFCIVTFLTIGFGSIVPTSAGGRSMCMILSIVGVIIMGLIVATLRAVVLSSAGPAIFWHQIEKERLRTLTKLEKQGKWLTPDQAFHKMRIIRKRVKWRQTNFSLVLTIVIFIVFWLLGAVVFWVSEDSGVNNDWTYFEAVYFCFMTLLTIGYGDFVPTTSFGKIFFVCWAIGAVPLMTILVSNLGDKLYDLFNHMSFLFSKWVFKSGEEEYEVNQFKKNQQKEYQSSTDVSTVNTEMVEREERDEEEEMSTLEEGDDPNAVLKNLYVKANPQFQRKLSILKNSTINRVNEKKKIHEDLLIFLEKLKPLITDSIENPFMKYSHKKWKEILEVLDQDEIDAINISKIEKTPDGFWLSDNSPLRLPLKEPNYLILRIYFKIEESLKDLVDNEIDTLVRLEDFHSNGTTSKVEFSDN
ncbi:uncharacterized protein J8A68_000942 [[Candida] subhashii]|uniref:Potassium channel domain-containing protein n=1 Tax=[Candida] subhashii TaxID=561895 RepID=A0A8J5V0L0_9ASCO|nr:uncharacterized protein J8A68_000942 [[Candida] subhashii]KAG7665540.1 hypothetical protein J8A68_000942 [[Candida] subhashii]